MAKIRFFYEGIQFTVTSPRKRARWIESVIKSEGQTISGINFIFCGDSYLHKLNSQYLRHDTLTDIITFQYSDPGQAIEGDVFISIPRVKENALLNKIEFETELSRVIIHGVLHMLGYSDKSAEYKAIMRQKEDAYLSLQ